MMTKLLLLASLLLLWVSILTTGLSVVYCLYHGVRLLLSTIITCLNVYIAVSYHQLSGSLRILSELIYDHVLEGGHVLEGEWSTELSYFGGVRTNLIDFFLRVHRNGIMELGANVEEDGEWRIRGGGGRLIIADGLCMIWSLCPWVHRQWRRCSN